MSVSALPPSVALLRLMTGSWISHAISLAARLGIADLLDDGPKRHDQLAQATETHPPSLDRVLSALASVGIFFKDDDGCFHLTPLAEQLRTDIPGSLRPFAIMLGEEWHWHAWGELPHSVRTGQSAFEHVYGQPIFAYLAQHPPAAAIFDQAMTSRSDDENRAVVAAYDFSGLGVLVDVGGGPGSFLAAILQATPGLRGVLFDRPDVIQRAQQQIESAGLHDRCSLVAGDFFESVPAGGDAYILKKVVHDWDDERALAILRNCHRAMPSNGRLLLVELVVPPGNDPSFARLLDLLMLVWTSGGRERTEAEHRGLLAAAGFELTRVIPTASPISLLEAIRR